MANPTTQYMIKKKRWQDYLHTLAPRPAWQITEDEIKTSDDHDATMFALRWQR